MVTQFVTASTVGMKKSPHIVILTMHHTVNLLRMSMWFGHVSVRPYGSYSVATAGTQPQQSYVATVST